MANTRQQPPTPTAPPPPPPNARPPLTGGTLFPPVAGVTPTALKFGKPKKLGKRVILYGVGGMGKTTLAASLPRVKFIDLDNSLASIGRDEIECVSPTGWADFRQIIKQVAAQGEAGEWYVIDSCTPLQTMCEAFVLQNVRTDKGATVRNIEGYGYGKGYRHIYDEWIQMLNDIDLIVARGINVCFIAHSSYFTVNNVDGDDFKRIEPRLQDSGGDGGKSSIKERMRDWADGVYCLREEIYVNKETGKAQGTGGRAIYSSVNPYCLAKIRKADGEQPPPMAVTPANGIDVWTALDAI